MKKQKHRGGAGEGIIFDGRDAEHSDHLRKKKLKDQMAQGAKYTYQGKKETMATAMAFLSAYFNVITESEFRRSEMTYLSHRQQVKFPAGTFICLYNETGLIGFCRLMNWEGASSPCRERQPDEQGIYTGVNEKYNRYRMRITDLHLLDTPIPYDVLRTMVRGDLRSNLNNNMWKRCKLSFRRVFGDNDDEVRRFKDIILALV